MQARRGLQCHAPHFLHTQAQKQLCLVTHAVLIPGSRISARMGPTVDTHQFRAGVKQLRWTLCSCSHSHLKDVSAVCHCLSTCGSIVIMCSLKVYSVLYSSTCRRCVCVFVSFTSSHSEGFVRAR